MNWNIPRNKAIEAVVDLARRGYPIPEVAQHVAEQHYTGKSIPRAVAQLTRDAFADFYDVYGARTHEQERVHKMAAELEAEGWKLTNEPYLGYMWTHPPTGNYVGQGGGLFDTFSRATIATYESQTRALLKRESTK